MIRHYPLSPLRPESVLSRRRMSWLLPSSRHVPELGEVTHRGRDLGVAVILHLTFCKFRVARLLLNVNISNNDARPICGL